MSQMIADFSKLKGIGPATEARLHGAGVVTWTALSNILTALGGIRGVSNETLRVLAKAAGEEAATAEPLAEPSGRTEAYVVKVVFDPEGVRTQVADARTKEEDRWSGWRPEETIDFIRRHAGLPSPALGDQERPHQPAAAVPPTADRPRAHRVLDAGKVVGGGSRRVDITVDTEGLALPAHSEVEYRAVLAGRPYGHRSAVRRQVASLTGRARPTGELALAFDTIELPEGVIQLELDIDFRALEDDLTTISSHPG